MKEIAQDAPGQLSSEEIYEENVRETAQEAPGPFLFSLERWGCLFPFLLRHRGGVLISLKKLEVADLQCLAI